MDEKHHPQSECPTPQICARAAQCFGDAFSTPQGLGSILDSLPMGVVVFDKQLHVVIANSQACRIIDPYGTVHKAIETATGKTAIEEWEEILGTVIRTGQKAQFGAIDIIRYGKKILVDIECTALRDIKAGQIIGGVLVLQDVTEKYTMQRKLSQAERFAAIGKVAGKVAHELNNPLDGIIRYINLALRSIEADQDNKITQYLEQSRHGLMRMAAIIRELLEYSRSSYLAAEAVSTSKVVEEAVKTIEPCAEDVRINVIKKCPRAASSMIDGKMFQVYCNILKNAVDAMQGTGNIDITIDSSDSMSVVSFLDTGPGFEKELEAEMFKPFFTTKPHGNGTGLGLAICKDIVEKFDGKIIAENTGKGSRFSVYLPL